MITEENFSDLKGSILISLFTDKSQWFGSQYGNDIGSNLYLLKNKVRDTTVLKLYEQYTEEALIWLKEKNIVKQIKCITQLKNNDLILKVFMTASDERKLIFKTTISGNGDILEHNLHNG